MSSVVSSVGTPFPVEVWWRHKIYFITFLYTLLVYLPDCWRMYAVPVVSSGVCDVHMIPFFPIKSRRVVRTNKQKGRSSAHYVQRGWRNKSSNNLCYIQYKQSHTTSFSWKVLRAIRSCGLEHQLRLGVEVTQNSPGTTLSERASSI